MTQGWSKNIHVMTQYGTPKQCQALYHKFKFCNHVYLGPGWTETHEHTTMDGWCKDMTFFFHWVLVFSWSPQDSRFQKCTRGSKLGFIQLFGLHNRKMRWCVWVLGHSHYSSWAAWWGRPIGRGHSPNIGLELATFVSEAPNLGNARILGLNPRHFILCAQRKWWKLPACDGGPFKSLKTKL
jgi:hypothetical protein